jgi:dolichol-phosphate mannosyltransferase
MERDGAVPTPPRGRAGRAIRARHNWVELAKFSVVGGTGFLVNLGVFSLLLHFGVHYIPAAVCSFLVAVTNNYTWNRLWTFAHHTGGVVYQGPRFLVVSLCALLANLAILSVLVSLGLDKRLAQAIAIVLVTPLNFIGNKLWSFSSTRG